MVVGLVQYTQLVGGSTTSRIGAPHFQGSVYQLSLPSWWLFKSRGISCSPVQGGTGLFWNALKGLVTMECYTLINSLGLDLLGQRDHRLRSLTTRGHSDFPSSFKKASEYSLQMKSINMMTFSISGKRQMAIFSDCSDSGHRCLNVYMSAYT